MCCGRNTKSAFYAASSQGTTYVKKRTHSKSGCEVTENDIAELMSQINKTNLPKEDKRRFRHELGVMAGEMNKKCPDPDKIEAIKIYIQDGNSTNTD